VRSPPCSSPAGAVGSGGVHQGRQGHRVASVRGDDAAARGGAAGRLPQAHEHGQAAHLRGDGQRALRVPAAGEAVHAAHHHQEQQHPGGPGDAQALLTRGEAEGDRDCKEYWNQYFSVYFKEYCNVYFNTPPEFFWLGVVLSELSLN